MSQCKNSNFVTLSCVFSMKILNQYQILVFLILFFFALYTFIIQDINALVPFQKEVKIADLL
jgi:hypothetical protein